MQMPEDDRMQRLEKALKILSRVYDNNKVAGIYIRGLILCDEPRISGRSIPHLASLLESPEKIKLHVTPMVGLTIKAINLCAKNLNDIAFNYLDLDATLSGNIYYYNDIVGEISLLRNSMYSLNNSLIRRALAFDEMAKTVWPNVNPKAPKDFLAKADEYVLLPIFQAHSKAINDVFNNFADRVGAENCVEALDLCNTVSYAAVRYANKWDAVCPRIRPALAMYLWKKKLS